MSFGASRGVVIILWFDGGLGRAGGEGKRLCCMSLLGLRGRVVCVVCWADLEVGRFGWRFEGGWKGWVRLDWVGFWDLGLGT